MDLQAVTGQLYVVEGMARETTAVPGLLAQSAPAKAARGRERDFLFVHLTLSGSATETAVLTQDLLDLISHTYYQSSGSVTAALRRAVLEANQRLLHFNVGGSEASREGAISCAVLRSGELFLLQVGEALALLGHNFGVERLPPKAPDRITPLGRTAGVDVRYFHYRLQTGDMLLLNDPRLAHLPTADYESALVDNEVELGLVELAGLMTDETARLLLVEFTDDAPPDLPNVGLATAPTAAATTRPAPAAAETTAVPQPTRAASTIQPPDPAVVEHKARQATADAVMGLSGVTAWLAELMSRLRPPRPAGAEDEPAVNWVIPAVLVLVIPVIVVVIVTSVYLERGRVRRFAEIKQEMGQALVLAETAEDAGETEAAHDAYNVMLTLAQEADTLRPGDDEITRLRGEAMSALDRLDGVLRLTGQPFFVYEEGVNLTAVVLGNEFNGDVYALDGANGEVYRHETDETFVNLTTDAPEQVAFAGQAVGSHVVRNLVDLMWRPSGSAVSRDGMAMLDGEGALLTYFPNFGDIRAVPLGLSVDWQQVTAMASFNERLYVLDTGAGEIWKYFPDGEGFVMKEDERTIVFADEPNLTQVVDLDLYSEDASLILLYGDGRIRYYDTRSGRIQWDERQLLQNGLGTPLVAPTAVKLVGRGLNASIYVADPGSGRIVQISRGGTVLAQYRAADENGRELFDRIVDFDVAETPLRIFVTAGDQLYVTMQE